jgi:hypothetical protein
LVTGNALFRDNKLVEIELNFYYTDSDNASHPELIVPELKQAYGPANETQTCSGGRGPWYINRWTFPKFKIECVSGFWQAGNSGFDSGTHKEVIFVDDSIQFHSRRCSPLF